MWHQIWEKRKVFDLFLKQPIEISGSRMIVRERIPDSGRHMGEVTRTDCFSSRSRTMRRRSWNRAERREERVGDTGTGSRDAVVGEVPGSQLVEAFEDKKTDLEPHPTANVKPM